MGDEFDDMEELSPATAVSVQVAARLAEELYGVVDHESPCAALCGECDANFRVGGFVLKVMHPGRDRRLIEMQCRVLTHLQQRAPHLTLPRVCRTTEGHDVTESTLDGVKRLVWMLTFIPGTVLAHARPQSPHLLASLGCLLGEVDSALMCFSHPGADRQMKWDLSRAGWIRRNLTAITRSGGRSLVEAVLERFEGEVLPALPRCRKSVIHGDANDHNVIVGPALPSPREVLALIDWGDMHTTVLVAEVAVAAAYCVMGQDDPLCAAVQVVRGYHSRLPLLEEEVGLLFTLIQTRLAVSVTNSAIMKVVKPDDAYVTISEAQAWASLEQLTSSVHPRFALYAFRQACDMCPVPHGPRLMKWLTETGIKRGLASVVEVNLREEPCLVFDLSVGSSFLGGDPSGSATDALSLKICGELTQAGVKVGVGRYDEPRVIYASDLFAGKRPTGERRTIHLGIDLFLPAGSPVFAPLDGVVHDLTRNTTPGDYGPLVILRHEEADDDIPPFFTLFGHMSLDTLTGLKVGESVVRGQCIGRMGDSSVNGGWPPHVHFQMILDILGLDAHFPGVAPASQRLVWTALSPDPNAVLGIHPLRFPPAPLSRDETLALRQQVVSKALSLSYDTPLNIVRGWRVFLYDETGRQFIDMFNNIPLVGHSHPRVVRAACDQLSVLNTNTRYLHQNLAQYACRLTSLLPAPLRVCILVNSGSEANELALRMARAHTGREEVIVLEHCYHGNSTTLTDVSPMKFSGPGGKGPPAWVRVAPLPDVYRGIHRRDDPNAGLKYAQSVGCIVDECGGVATFLHETIPSVAGQIVLPEGYLAEAYRLVRKGGGVVIADEVQTGLGRLGTCFWGFEAHGVVPDIVVLGKPLGNGFPLSCVVVTPDIAASFDNGMEYFSSFGGSAVAAAVGQAVLDVIKEEELQARALAVGNHLLEGLREKQLRFPLIGDVRGSGLFIGVELVESRVNLAPATAQARYVVERLCEKGVLTGTDGPHRNVIKLRPPLVLTESEADVFLASLEEVLEEDGAQPP